MTYYIEASYSGLHWWCVGDGLGAFRTCDLLQARRIQRSMTKEHYGLHLRVVTSGGLVVPGSFDGTNWVKEGF